MIVNGKEKNLPQGTTVLALLKELGLNQDTVVVEVNLEIIDKSKYQEVQLDQRDNIEIVGFIGGG
ncbi:MAG: sulfur carrier protein ThiS [Clostridiaceae bacterium]|nr:sulfur carrier protein ThiS [Clostridiaceae bacterium]